jgi:hypothetical protein
MVSDFGALRPFFHAVTAPAVIFSSSPGEEFGYGNTAILANLPHFFQKNVRFHPKTS